MLWFLIPAVVGVVAAVVAGSGDDEQKKLELEARDAQRKKDAETKAFLMEQARQAEKNKRQLQLELDATEQFRELLRTHAAIIDRRGAPVERISFERLKSFADKSTPAHSDAMVKYLENMLPDVVLSDEWQSRESEIEDIKNRIKFINEIKCKLLSREL